MDNSGKNKLVILGDNTTQLLSKAIKKLSKKHDFAVEVYEADYDQIEQNVFDLGSELYSFEPNFILLFKSTQKLYAKFLKMPVEDRALFSDDFIAEHQQQIDHLKNETSVNIISNNFYEIDDATFGNYANKVNQSFIFQLRKINFKLAELSQNYKNLFILDLATIQNKLGQREFLDNRMLVMASMSLSVDGYNAMASELLKILLSIKGNIKKCLILDLDNTLWGGVIGDDGIENIQIGELGLGKAYSNLQSWAKELKNRGIILAICSKNNEEIAKEPFDKHPDMVLKLNDIAVFVANWGTKVDNIKHIQKVLNIGFDSMVFIDDNPFERNIVRENIHEITVPELPEDPTEYLSFLQSLNLFETATFLEGDQQRTKQYQNEAKRIEIKKTFSNEKSFLESLNMQCIVEKANKFNIPRIAQLTQRSNQFNLRTQRYTDEQIAEMTKSDNYEILTFSLSDKFGDNGLVSVIILEKRKDTLFIDTWIMSCRVLKRGLEHFVLNQIVTFAANSNFDKVVGEYLPTPKNQLVENHYPNLGFRKKGLNSELLIQDYKNKEVFIKRKLIN